MKDAITNANNRLKAPCRLSAEKRGWSYPRGARAAELLKTVRKHGLLPDYLDNSFDQLAAILHSGLPKVRGEQGAHGQGPRPERPPTMWRPTRSTWPRPISCSSSRRTRRWARRHTPPLPDPLRDSFISLNRRALAQRAWLSRLATLGGGEGERAAPSASPLRPWGEGDRGRWVRRLRGNFAPARGILSRACDPICRAHDLSGVRDSGTRDSIFRARDLSGSRDLRTIVRCTARAAGPGLPAMRRSFSRARVRATQCQSTPGTADAMGEGASDSRCRAQSRTPSPQPSRAAPAWTRSWPVSARGDGDRSPLISRARRCARARPAEGRWGRAHGGPDLPAAREPTALPRNGSARATPAPRGLAPSSRSRPCERWRSARWPSSARTRSRCRPRTSAASPSALYRIEAADRLRVEREQAMADAAAHAGPAARAATMTHAERVETVRRALEGHVFPARTESPPLASGWAEAPPADSHVTSPDPTPESPADDGAQDAQDAAGAQDAQDAAGTQDVSDARVAQDAWDARMARDAELRRREAEGRLWPTDPPFCPAGMERARVRRGIPHPPQPGHALDS